MYIANHVNIILWADMQEQKVVQGLALATDSGVCALHTRGV